MSTGIEKPSPPLASKEVEKRTKLSLEIKRLLLQIEAEVEGLDWCVRDRFNTVPNLAEPAEHLLAAGGKRVRPLLINLLSKALGTPFEPMKACAIAAELVHTATLLHDDILDGATTRRGRIAAHLKYDSHTAILSGDALLSKAISDIAELGDPEILKRLANTVRELVEGECLQADLEGKVHKEFDLVLEVARRKTASLFAWSSWVAGHISGKHSEDLFKFGTHLGIAFQLLDDVLDWESTQTGKPPYLDLHEAKLNSVGVTLVIQSPKAQEILLKAFENRGEHSTIANFAEIGISLKSLPEYINSVEIVRKEAETHSAFCLSYLDKLPPTEWKDLAKNLVNQLLQRMK